MGKSDIKNKVMKRVYFIWFSKKIAPAIFLYIPFLVFVSLREAAREFFVLKIVDNFLFAVNSSGFAGAMNFTLSALTNTPVLPVLIIVSSTGLSVYLLRRLARNFRQTRLARSAT